MQKRLRLRSTIAIGQDENYWQILFCLHNVSSACALKSNSTAIYSRSYKTFFVHFPIFAAKLACFYLTEKKL